METLIIDLSDASSEWPEGSPLEEAAGREVAMNHEGKDYILSVLQHKGNCLIGLRTTSGEACPDFAVIMHGTRHTAGPGREFIELGRRSWLDLASLQLQIQGHPVRNLHILPAASFRPVYAIDAAREQRAAWRILVEERTRPPRDQRNRENANDIVNINENWISLASSLVPSLPAPTAPEPAPGQIWSLSPQLDGWDEQGRYLRMPLVLLVSTEGNIRGAFCCSEPALSGALDVPLGAGFGFAEAWNIRTLPRLALGKCWESVDSELVQEVLQGSREVLPPAQTSWEESFQMLERETGEICERRALVLHLAKLQRPSPLARAQSLFANLTQALRDLLPHPHDHLPPALAADGTHVADVLVCRDNGIVEHHHAEIMTWAVVDGTAYVDGRLSLPPEVVPSIIVVMLLSPGEHDFSVVTESLGEGPLFSVRLPLPGAEEEVGMSQLRLRAVCYGS